jgi:hypothetical protein
MEKVFVYVTRIEKRMHLEHISLPACNSEQSNISNCQQVFFIHLGSHKDMWVGELLSSLISCGSFFCCRCSLTNTLTMLFLDKNIN